MVHEYARGSAQLRARSIRAHAAGLLRFAEKWSAVVYAVSRFRGRILSLAALVTDVLAAVLAFLAAYGIRTALNGLFEKPVFPLPSYGGLLFFTIAVTVAVLRLRCSSSWPRPSSSRRRATRASSCSCSRRSCMRSCSRHARSWEGWGRGRAARVSRSAASWWSARVRNRSAYGKRSSARAGKGSSRWGRAPRPIPRNPRNRRRRASARSSRTSGSRSCASRPSLPRCRSSSPRPPPSAIRAPRSTGQAPSRSWRPRSGWAAWATCARSCSTPRAAGSRCARGSARAISCSRSSWRPSAGAPCAPTSRAAERSTDRVKPGGASGPAV